MNDIIINGYVINKVIINDDFCISAGDMKYNIENILGKTDEVLTDPLFKPLEIFGFDSLNYYCYNNLDILLGFEDLSIISVIIIDKNNKNASFCGIKVGMKVDISNVDLISADSEVYTKTKFILTDDIMNKFGVYFMDKYPEVKLYFKLINIDNNLAIVDKIIIKFPKYIKGIVSEDQMNTSVNSLSNWCNIIMRNPKNRL